AAPLLSLRSPGLAPRSASRWAESTELVVRQIGGDPIQPGADQESRPGRGYGAIRVQEGLLRQVGRQFAVASQPPEITAQRLLIALDECREGVPLTVLRPLDERCISRLVLHQVLRSSPRASPRLPSPTVTN